jgi:uncharacterized protein YpbB
MLIKANEIKDVAVKFQSQLEKIVQSQTDVLNTLTERCSKAVVYFQKEIVEGMLLSLQEYINGFKIKKAKAFHKNLCGLEQDIKLFIENMKKARYNDVPLIKGQNLPVPERKNLINSDRSQTVQYVEKEKTGFTQLKEKYEKQRQESANQTFDMFRQGLTIKEIVTTRNISEGTVLSHLAEFVQSGKMAVTELVSQDIIDELTPWVQAAIAEDNMFLKPIKEATGERFSYNDIRFVMSHCLYGKNKK